ncbi:hypothetical protein B0T26DRAFT_190619 [Lasiosphaeria miniovina]|uniref:Uncharacterized protein n=1 Tax=Lasiosphaeria miniovina TaxID=1954250 RepID=A0AA40ATE1_9PEZI|nr:uncharacterized protein B0T26DRAFT_190619 [Lasiosphaeria miniovina]KAK0721675.1 hypothetical protein B0T26DRAFT_190619 [Lasiosphaeria miniovina]
MTTLWPSSPPREPMGAPKGILRTAPNVTMQNSIESRYIASPPRPDKKVHFADPDSPERLIDVDSPRVAITASPHPLKMAGIPNPSNELMNMKKTEQSSTSSLEGLVFDRPSTPAVNLAKEDKPGSPDWTPTRQRPRLPLALLNGFKDLRKPQVSNLVVAQPAPRLVLPSVSSQRQDDFERFQIRTVRVRVQDIQNQGVVSAEEIIVEDNEPYKFNHQLIAEEIIVEDNEPYKINHKLIAAAENRSPLKHPGGYGTIKGSSALRGRVITCSSPRSQNFIMNTKTSGEDGYGAFAMAASTMRDASETFHSKVQDIGQWPVSMTTQGLNNMANPFRQLNKDELYEMATEVTASIGERVLLVFFFTVALIPLLIIYFCKGLKWGTNTLAVKLRKSPPQEYQYGFGYTSDY